MTFTVWKELEAATSKTDVISDTPISTCVAGGLFSMIIPRIRKPQAAYILP